MHINLQTLTLNSLWNLTCPYAEDNEVDHQVGNKSCTCTWKDFCVLHRGAAWMCFFLIMSWINCIWQIKVRILSLHKTSILRWYQ